MAPSRDTTGVIAHITRAQHGKLRSRDTSPRLPGHYDDDISTITSFQPDHESTQQFDTAADLHSVSVDVTPRARDDSLFSEVASVEAGRGDVRAARASLGRYDLGLDMSEERVLDLGENSMYDMVATPPMKHKVRKSSGLRRQVSNRHAAALQDDENTKVSDIVPSKIRTSKHSGRRTLSDMHAKVHAISDSSFIQPETKHHIPQKSRFAPMRSASAHAELPTRFTAGVGLGRDSDMPRRPASIADTSALGNQTAQSFMLPDLPNIAELVSGVRAHGTPVISKTTKPKSRFTSARHSVSHRPVQSVALPDDEKAIFISLQLLKEKVETLESEKEEAIAKVDSLEDEILGLRSQVKMERRLRQTDGGHAGGADRSAPQNWHVERGQLQGSLAEVQDRLERAEAKLKKAEANGLKMAHERDSLVNQIGVAFYTTEQLKDENTKLADEMAGVETHRDILADELRVMQEVNKELEQQLLESEKQHDSNLRSWAIREAELKSRAGHTTERKGTGTERRRSTDEPRAAKTSIMDRVQQEVRRARAEAVRQSQSAENILRTRSKSASRQRKAQAAERADTNTNQEAAKQRMLREWSENVEDSQSMLVHEGTEHAYPTIELNDKPTATVDDDTKDITYISFLDPEELARLRKKLELERAASKAKDTKMTKPGQEKDAVRSVRIQSPATADHISYSSPDDAIDMSILSTGYRRPQRTKSFEEMTSAFLLPDITLHKSPAPKSSDSEVAASMPLQPVTEREDVDQTAATIRPAQEPREALAMVLKQLEAEVAELKQQLGRAEKEYEEHDPAIGKRRRVGLKEKIEKLVGEVERRSEQVYGLYDVLEGQKEIGKDMVEETLRGLDVPRRGA